MGKGVVVAGAGAFWVIGVGAGLVVAGGAPVASELPGKFSALGAAIKPKTAKPIKTPAIAGFISLSYRHCAELQSPHQ